MDETSNMTDRMIIDFVLSGKVHSLSHAQWSSLIWRFVESNSSVFKDFLGFCPLKEFYMQKTGGGFRTIREEALYPNDAQIRALSYPQDFFDQDCKELAVLLETTRLVEENPRTEVYEQWSMVITRDARLLSSRLGFTRTWMSEHECSEEIRQLDVIQLSEPWHLCNVLASLGGSKKVLSGIVELARATHARHQEMADKALQTFHRVYEQFHAILGRVENSGA